MANEIKDLLIQSTISNEEIKNLIYTIRGKQVMLDSEISATKWHDKEYKIYFALKIFIILI